MVKQLNEHHIIEALVRPLVLDQQNGNAAHQLGTVQREGRVEVVRNV